METTPAFVRCSEFGGSVLRGIDLSALVENQSVPYCLSIVEMLPLFKRVHLGRFHYQLKLWATIDGPAETTEPNIPISKYI